MSWETCIKASVRHVNLEMNLSEDPEILKFGAEPSPEQDYLLFEVDDEVLSLE